MMVQSQSRVQETPVRGVRVQQVRLLQGSRRSQQARVRRGVRTRRGWLRIMQWLAVWLLALAAVLLAPTVVRALAGPVGGPPVEQVEVRPGDSLWTIAEMYNGGRTDIRETIQEIKNYNRLRESTLYPGQVLLIPLPQ